MASIADELAAIPFLGRTSERELRASAALWTVVTLAAGESLWDVGSAVDELGIVAAGELVAEVDGVEVGRILPGELCGEASAFFLGQIRSATLRARSPSQVLTLATPSLRTLRWQRSPVYEALLEQALITLVRRVRATDAKIAQVAVGVQAAPVRVEPSALVRFWKTFRPGGPTGPCPPLEPLLRRLPGLREAAGEVIAAIGQGFVAEAVAEGQVIFLEGDAGAATYLVAEGQVDVLRHVRGHRAERLAALEKGDQFGVNTLVERGARTASCLAASAGWLYRMDAEAYGRLRGETRLVWRESVLAALATQIRGANDALQKTGRADSEPARPGPKSTRPKKGDDGFRELLRASGYLEGLPTSEVELERIQVVLTEDARRNPKRR